LQILLGKELDAVDKLVEKYFTNEKHMSHEEALKNYEEIAKHPAILKEFLFWVYTGQYVSKVKVEGYTARQIFDMANYLDGVGVFNFLITLIERPKEGIATIQDGFKRK